MSSKYIEIPGSGKVLIATGKPRTFQQDPRKIVSGTSYESKGSTKTPSEAMKERGSSRPTRIPDVVPQFASRQQMLRVFKEMEDGDTTFDVALRATKVPIQGAHFFVQPFDKKQVNKDISEFVSFNIFEGTSRPFVLVLEDILRMFNDGFAVLEQVWERREWTPRRAGANRKKYTMLRNLAVRPALTIEDINYDDNGGPVSVIHNAIRASGNAEKVEIKIDQLLVFTFGILGGDLTGKPLGRTAHNPWYFKKELYKIDAIGHERNHLGIPEWELPEGYSTPDVDSAWEQVTNVRTNEKTGIVKPPGHGFRLVRPEGGQVSDIMPSIEHHDSKILLNVMAQFMLLGLSAGGGRATSGAHVDMFQKAMKYIANYICGVFNLYLVPKLVGYNFDTSEFPKMRVRNIGETKDIQMWAAAHGKLLHEKAITMDEDTENWYRENLDMPYLLGPRPDEVKASRNGGREGSVQPGGKATGDASVEPGFDSTA